MQGTGNIGRAPVRGGAGSKLVVALATGFGLGYSPVASGTVGSLWGVLIVLGAQYLPGLGWQIALVAALSLAAIPICGHAEERFGRKDDGRIVADEYVTLPIVLIGMLPASGPVVDCWLVLTVAFVVHRVLDIIKPFPAGRLQDVRGGPGIVLDDVVSSAYAWLLVNFLLAIGFIRFHH